MGGEANASSLYARYLTILELSIFSLSCILLYDYSS